MRKFDLNGHKVTMTISQSLTLLRWIIFNKTKLHKIIDMLDLGWNFHAAFKELTK
jgi:hypothetical protein